MLVGAHASCDSSHCGGLPSLRCCKRSDRNGKMSSIFNFWAHAICRDDRGRLVLGDIITGFNGKPVKLQKDLFALLDDCKVHIDLKPAAVRAIPIVTSHLASNWEEVCPAAGNHNYNLSRVGTVTASGVHPAAGGAGGAGKCKAGGPHGDHPPDIGRAGDQDLLRLEVANHSLQRIIC